MGVQKKNNYVYVYFMLFKEKMPKKRPKLVKIVVD